MTYKKPVQLEMDLGTVPSVGKPLLAKGAIFNDLAFVANKNAPIHRWVPWIAGFSKDFVSGVLSTHLSIEAASILDPFTGVGTTLVESLLHGHNVIGFEINPYPLLATKTKLSISNIPVEKFKNEIKHFSGFYNAALLSKREPLSIAPIGFNTRVPFYSPAVLRKVLYITDFINIVEDSLIRDLFRIAFASTMVSYSNYSYEPSLGTKASSGKSNVEEAPVGEIILSKLNEMLSDIEWYWKTYPVGVPGTQQVINDSFFACSNYLESDSIDLIVTSPPYLNNYHYNRNTRPQLYWLEYVHHPKDLNALEYANFGTYWQTAREVEHIDLKFELPESDLNERLSILRKTNVEKGLYGGNGWANYAAAYFNDCREFAIQAQRVLKPGGTALIVIGNSILQGIMIPTDKYLAAIAQEVGLEIVNINTPRTTRVGNSIIQSKVRSVKANSQHQLYESVVILRK